MTALSARKAAPSDQVILAEQSVLGGLLLDSTCFNRVSDTITADDFSRREHHLIFNAVSALCRENKPADVITVSEWLERRGESEAAGGLAYVGSLANNTPGTANIVAYSEIVHKHAAKRKRLADIEKARAALLAGNDEAAERILRVAPVTKTVEKPVTSEWPAPLDGAAFHGIAGDIVLAIEPHTEADPAAILLQFLVAAGSLIGRGPHVRVEGDEHHGNLFVLNIGDTSKGRKGTSWGRVQSVFEQVLDSWASERVLSGLSSGEGLIWQVRDAIYVREDGKETLSDPGVSDKRLLVLESEFASTLRVMERDGNTLSALVRQAWDKGNLRTLTKNSAAVATGAHISLNGHITADELRRYLTRTEAGNGFANRFLFCCVKRSKCLPDGGGDVDLAPYARRLALMANKVRTFGRVTFDDVARATWHQVYPDLSEGRPGLLGAVTSRAEAQTLRLALIYALLDSSDQIRAEHLRAALAVWEYCEASARFVFGTAVGDPVADDLLRAIRSSGANGMTRTGMRDLFKRNRSGAEIGAALELLGRLGHISARQVSDTGGRPAEVWVGR